MKRSVAFLRGCRPSRPKEAEGLLGRSKPAPVPETEEPAESARNSGCASHEPGTDGVAPLVRPWPPC